MVTLTAPQILNVKTAPAAPAGVQQDITAEPALPMAKNGGLYNGPWYYAAQYLHRRPSPLRPIRPVYPEQANDSTHTIRILLFISAEGQVDSYRLLEGVSSGEFANAVVSAFANASYAPGLIADIQVRSQLLAEVTFDPGRKSAHLSISTPIGENLLADLPALGVSKD